MMPRRLVNTIQEKGGTVLLNRDVTAVEVRSGRVVAVQVTNKETGVSERHECDYCISTMPMPWLVQRMDAEVSPEVQESAGFLRFKPITVHGLLVNKPKCLNGLYIYYRERIFHRVGDPKNAGLIVDPPDHSVLIVETTCEEGDDKWTGSPAVREAIIKDLEIEKICTRDQIVQWHVMNSSHGYPVFKLGFEEHFDRVKAHIDKVVNLRSVGRQGGFTYPNMHGAMRMGANAAKSVLGQISSETGA
jgi:protoporphyrinogen oxidase